MYISKKRRKQICTITSSQTQERDLPLIAIVVVIRSTTRLNNEQIYPLVSSNIRVK